MFLQKRKRVKLTLEEKLWILSHKKENRAYSNAKVALDFSVKFKRPISKNCVQNILSQKESIQSILKAAPDLDVKKPQVLDRPQNLNSKLSSRRYWNQSTV